MKQSAIILLLSAICLPQASLAQDIVLTLDEAIQIALVENLSVERTRLDVDFGDAQVREGWGELFPSLDVSSSYTRNIKTANPFAGSQAGGFFQSLGFIDWLAFNEQARTDGDPSSNPISVGEYFMRQQAGMDAAGISQDGGDNPFGVPNQYMAGLSVTQKLFDGRVIFGAVGASRWLGPFNQAGLDRQQQVVVHDVRRGFYGVLLATQQAEVAAQSVARAQRTLMEVSRQVDEGVAPKFQRLSAEVEVANLESALVQSETARDAALDNLKLLLGVPVSESIVLRGSLETDADASLILSRGSDAASIALQKRPDLQQAKIGIELERIQLNVAKAEFLPTLDAFFNYSLVGNVPDNRSITVTSPTDPFSFSTRNEGYFSDAYWDRTSSGGFRLSWNIFNGRSSTQRLQQRKIAMRQAELDTELLERSIVVEIDATLRDVRSARIRLESQRRNVSRAELNFEYAEARLAEGVASPLEVREASNQLDQTRLNYLQAVHDYLVAESAYETALGQTPFEPTSSETP